MPKISTSMEDPQLPYRGGGRPLPLGPTGKATEIDASRWRPQAERRSDSVAVRKDQHHR
jgi:hypothetical protein